MNAVPAPMYARPSQNTTEASKPAISDVQTSKTLNQLREFKTSIRTMEDDIAKIKVGQQPSGVDINRTVAQSAPLPVATPTVPGPSPLPATPNAPASRPPLVSSGFSIPATPSRPAISTAPSAAPSTGSVLKPSVPGAMPLPKIPMPPTGSVAPNINNTAGGGFNKLFIAIPVLLLVLGIGAYFLFFNSPQIAVETPTPSKTAEPTPSTTPLAQMFGANVAEVPIVSSASPIEDFYAQLAKVDLASTEFKRVTSAGESGSLGLPELFDRFMIAHPVQLNDIFGAERIAVIYGQKETFAGQDATATVDGQKRLVLITEVKDTTNATSILRQWEATSMTTDLGKLLVLDFSKKKPGEFSDNSYPGATIRYQNFPTPDRSIDYAFIQAASTGKTYLVLGNSREAVYAALSRLQ